MPRMTQSYSDAPFATVKETARRTGVSVYSIRQRIQAGKCPVVYSGDNVRVNVPLFQRMLEEESKACLQENSET